MKLKLLVLIALTGLIAVWYFSKPKPVTAPKVSPTTPTTSSSSTTTNSEANTIAYTDTGFSPKTITVKPGTAVTFVNQSSTKMWVASAVHPTHLELPGFDELKGEPKGSTYSFTFKDVGTWKFHDHLNPSSTGSVIVAQ